MTFDALLDASGLLTTATTNSDDEYESKTGGKRSAVTEPPTFIPHPTIKRNKQVQTKVKEACMEIICILIQQDVNGFFHFPLKQDPEVSSLRGLERLIISDKLTSLLELQKKINYLFAKAPIVNPVVATEAFRLAGIATQWFNSLVDGTLWINEDDSAAQTYNENEVTGSLRLLNPDNDGIVSTTERVRTIGEEVGPLAFGTHLSQYGGYHEDRRNKVIPYTYLNYGPFSSFGPAYDSGASNCSPEANELLLGTSWRPARLLHIKKKDMANENTKDEDTSPWSYLSAENDPELQVVLADCEAEWQEGQKQAKALDAIMPPAGCGDDFSLYLANVLLKGMTESDETNEKPQNGEQKSNIAEDKGPVSELTSINQLLSESSAHLRQLYNAQYRRLGESSLGSDRSLYPSHEERDTACHLVGQLTSLISRVTPSEVCSREAVRKSLNIAYLPLSPTAVVDIDNSKC